jgi:hypothetical protein
VFAFGSGVVVLVPPDVGFVGSGAVGSPVGVPATTVTVPVPVDVPAGGVVVVAPLSGGVVVVAGSVVVDDSVVPGVVVVPLPVSVGIVTGGVCVSMPVVVPVVVPPPVVSVVVGTFTFGSGGITTGAGGSVVVMPDETLDGSGEVTPGSGVDVTGGVVVSEPMPVDCDWPEFNAAFSCASACAIASA